MGKLHACGQRVATVKAVHSGPNASKGSSDDAGGLEPVVCLAKSARVMLSSNLWVDMDLPWEQFNPSATRLAKPLSLVTVLFDHYSGRSL